MITIYDSHGHFITYDALTFSGGEEHIRLAWKGAPSSAKIVAHLRAGRDIIQLLMVTDALRRAGFVGLDLVMPYVPYARQDRVCNPGEALSIKVFCDLINSQKYRSVEIWDAHSDVTVALLDRCKNIHQVEWTVQIQFPNMKILSPDAGAEKKAYVSAKVKGRDLVVCKKHRDTKTGDITGVSVGYVMQDGSHYLIVDDICDGGKTFIEISKAIKSQAPHSKVSLYVTHGIFSKGLDALKPYIDHVYTANIWPERYEGNEGYVTILRKG